MSKAIRADKEIRALPVLGTSCGRYRTRCEEVRGVDTPSEVQLESWFAVDKIFRQSK